MFLHFAQSISRKLIDHHKAPRAFEGCEIFPAASFERIQVAVTARNDIGCRNLASHPVGLAYDGRLCDFRLFHQELFNLARIDVEPARYD